MKTSSQNYLFLELKNHWLAYVLLCIGLVTGATFFVVLWPNREQQRLVVLGLSGFYFCWGVMTHFKTQRITRKVISEYFAVSLLAGGLLYFLTL